MNNLNPSWRTICSLVNTMIGGTMLTLPILFRQAGLISGILILLASGLISYKTCSLYIIHMSQKQSSIQQTIQRLLGKTSQKFFRLITGVYLIFLNFIYIDLIVDQSFNILHYIFHHTGHQYWITDKDQKSIVFNKISAQTLSLLFFLPLLLMMFIKNLSLLVKITSFGVVSSIAYTFFIYFQFFDQIKEIKIQPQNWWSWNFGSLAATSAIAFTIHTTVTPIIKVNRYQNSNLRDLKISYLCGFIIYAGIGIFGSLPILFQDPTVCTVHIINCYIDKTKLVLVVESLYFFMLFTVFPCFINVGRTRLLTLFFGQVQQKHITGFNLLFMFAGCALSFFSPFFGLDLIMSFVGALPCFFFIYFIPIMFHRACLYKTKISSLQQFSSTSDSVIQNDTPLDQKLKQSLGQQSEYSSSQIACQHAHNYVDTTNKNIRYGAYITVMAVGAIVLVYGLYDVIRKVVHKT